MQLPQQQGVDLTGHNTTGPPRAAPWWVTLYMRVLRRQTTTTDDRPAIIKVNPNLCQPSPSLKKWRILLD